MDTSLKDLFLNLKTDRKISKISELTRVEPYKYQVWVYACISLITNNLSGLSRFIYNTRTEEEITDHDILRLFNSANPETFGKTFFESIIMHLLLDGQVFVLPSERGILGKLKAPPQLYVIKDKYMKPKLNSFNIIDKWKYDPGSGSLKIYNSNELVRTRFYNPYDKTKGLAPLDAALFTIYTDAAAMSYTANFFKNGAQIGGVLTTDKKLNEEQSRAIAEMFSENYSGEDKAGKTPILHSGLNYQSISSTFKDMQYKEQQEFVKERILAAFKVPRSLVADYSEVNYSNSITAKKTFWQENLLPLDGLINSAFTYQWLRNIDPDLELRSDYSKVEALQEIESEKVSAYKTLIDSGLPREEAARILNIPIDWSSVEELEAEDENIEEPEEPTAGDSTEEEEEEEEKSIDTRQYAKTLKGSINKFTTMLRNKTLNKIDNNNKLEHNTEVEFKNLFNGIKDAYTKTLDSIIMDGGPVNVSSEDIVDFLNKRLSDYKTYVKNIIDNTYKLETKSQVFDFYQNIYGVNKHMAEKEMSMLVRFIATGENPTKESGEQYEK